MEEANKILKDSGDKAMLASDSSAEMYYADGDEMFTSVALEGTGLDGSAPAGGPAGKERGDDGERLGDLLQPLPGGDASPGRAEQ